MPTGWTEFIRTGFARPREATRRLLAMDLSMSTVLQGALLLAILNALVFNFLYDVMEALSLPPVVILAPPLMQSVLTNLLFILLASYFVAMLSAGFGKRVSFTQSASIFVWFNILQLGASVAAFAIVALAGLLGAFVIFLPILWTLWAIGQYWAELVGSENAIVGFVLILVAVMITFPILGLIVVILGLPGLEVVQDV